MSQKKYKVTLTEDEKNALHEIINKGKHSAQKCKRAQALLLAHEAYTDEMIADRVGMHRRGIEELRQRFVEEGFETVLEGKPGGHRPAVSPGKTRHGLSPWYAGRYRKAVPGGRYNY
jgi:transposase